MIKDEEKRTGRTSWYFRYDVTLHVREIALSSQTKLIGVLSNPLVEVGMYK